MTMSLRMMMKPPVAFFCPDPEKVFSSEGVHHLLDHCGNSREVFPTLWAAYCREVLDQVEPCMEPNGGALETACSVIRGDALPGLKAFTVSADTVCLSWGDAGLYLQDTPEGDTFLYFLPPGAYYSRREECRLDLTGYGTEAAAAFIAKALESFPAVRRFLCLAAVPGTASSVSKGDLKS